MRNRETSVHSTRRCFRERTCAKYSPTSFTFRSFAVNLRKSFTLNQNRSQKKTQNQFYQNNISDAFFDFGNINNDKILKHRITASAYKR